MRSLAVAGLVLASAALLGAGTALAGGKSAAAGAAAAATDFSSQSSREDRARTRIRVTPTRRIVRQCSFRLVQEVRASGTYVVPRERCWWVPHPP